MKAMSDVNLEPSSEIPEALTRTLRTTLMGMYRSERVDFISMLYAAGLDRDCVPGGDWRGVDFSGDDLTGLDFSDCDLRGCKFDRTIIDNCFFEGAQLDPGALKGAIKKASSRQGRPLGRVRINKYHKIGIAKRLGVKVSELPRALSDYHNMRFARGLSGSTARRLHGSKSVVINHNTARTIMDIVNDALKDLGDLESPIFGPIDFDWFENEKPDLDLYPAYLSRGLSDVFDNRHFSSQKIQDLLGVYQLVSPTSQRKSNRANQKRVESSLLSISSPDQRTLFIQRLQSDRRLSIGFGYLASNCLHVSLIEQRRSPVTPPNVTSLILQIRRDTLSEGVILGANSDNQVLYASRLLIEPLSEHSDEERKRLSEALLDAHLTGEFDLRDDTFELSVRKLVSDPEVSNSWFEEAFGEGISSPAFQL